MQEDLMTSLKSVKNVLEDSGPATLNSCKLFKRLELSSQMIGWLQRPQCTPD